MSDIIYRIFSRYYYPKCTDDRVKHAAGMLKLTSNGRITFTNYKSVQFIDYAGELEHIFCPWCGREVDRELWQEATDTAYDGSAFKYLRIRIPCCHQPSSLGELIYVKPYRFVTSVTETWNPQEVSFVVELHEMGRYFGNVHSFRMISACIQKGLIHKKACPP